MQFKQKLEREGLLTTLRTAGLIPAMADDRDYTTNTLRSMYQSMVNSHHKEHTL